MLGPGVLDSYDIFIFSEDDLGITTRHVDDFRTWTHKGLIPADWIVGFLQFVVVCSGASSIA